MAGARVVIVGGGIAGVSLAYELSADHQVTVLEAEGELAMHSTGRSAALFLTGYGPPAVQSLTASSADDFRRFETTADTPELLTPRGLLMTAWDSDSERSLRSMLERSASTLHQIDADQVRTLCPALRVDDLLLAAYDAAACDIDVMALHGFYVRGLHRRGGEIRCRATVTNAVADAEGWRIITAQGWHGYADVIVNAAGAWADDVAARCGVAGHSLTPCRRTVVICPATGVDRRWPVVADANERWYFKPEGNALLLSPGDETPVAPGHVRPDSLDVAIALERVNERTTLDLRSVSTSWAGLRTFTPDRSPAVGWHPDAPGLFSFVGQGGYGVQMAPALARFAAGVVRGEREPAGAVRA